MKEVKKEGNEKDDKGKFEMIKVIGKGYFGKVLIVRKVVGKESGNM
jgi:hypothetical protein